MSKSSSFNRAGSMYWLALAIILTPHSRSWAQSTAAAQNTVRIDASLPFTEPQPGTFQGGTATSPSGETIGSNARYLTLNGKPWLPVMGEFHYSRYPEDRWEEEILKMKEGGVQIIATYIFWIHHEEVEGQFVWSGQRNLRHFVELCAKHGMYVYPRLGPWAHGETRNGGLPDWLLAKAKIRTNDPAYLGYVQPYYDQIGVQLKGLLWKDGGPVIGVQLENEYSMRGPGAGAEHILQLKKMAIQSGLDVPLYTVTGWDNAAIPQGGEVLPVFGGYPDAPWDASPAMLPPAEVYAFRFGNRVSANMGAIGATKEKSTKGEARRNPFITAEMGGGMQDTYHRRPVVSADDVVALCPVMLGSGVNLYGTYMFQGGENPEGKLTTLQESQATKYPTDVPIKSYDFQAPLGEFGQERESFRKFKLFNYFLNDFGPDLAPMTTHAPGLLPNSPADLSVIRASVRSQGDRGYIFVNNHVRGSAMPERKSTQFILTLPGETLNIPRNPVTVPSGAYFIWPFNLDMNGAKLKYATAQLFTRIDNGSSISYIFFAIPGVPAEFAIDRASIDSLESSAGKAQTTGDITYVTAVEPGLNASINIHTRSGSDIRIIVLTSQQAETAWKVTFAGKPHLVVSPQAVFADDDTMHLQSTGSPDFRFTVMPQLDGTLQGSAPIHAEARAGNTSSFSASVSSQKLPLSIRQIQKSSAAPPINLGPSFPWRAQGVAEAPPEAAFASAAKWRIHLPADSMHGLNELFLSVDYVGDVARLSSGDHLLADDFYNGLPWSIGLSRFLKTGVPDDLVLSILPLRKDSPVYLESTYRPDFHANAQTDALHSLKLIPGYELTVNTNPRTSR